MTTSHSSESELRKRLFAKGKPFIRPYQHERDAWVLWAAYDLGAFRFLGEGLQAEEFHRALYAYSARAGMAGLWLIEDDSKHFRGGRGPVCLVGIKSDGWRIEPHFEWFKWASPRIVLRGYVIFFQKVRFAKDVGVCLVRTVRRYVSTFHHLRRYGVLYYVGKIPNGYPNDDEFDFTVKGKLQLSETVEQEKEAA